MATTRRHRTRPTGSRIRRLAGGVAALVAILAMLVGVPYALYALAGNPLPDHVPDWSHLGELLTTRDDGSLFLGAITWVGWLGWASFALPLLVEIPFQLARRRPPRILGLAWQQRRAAALVAAALSIGATPAVASASAVTIAPAPAVAAPSQTWTPPQQGRPAIYDMLAGPAPAATTAAPANGGPIYEVARRDWLYYIAERFLGDGDRYPQIAALNPELERADPRFPDHIEPGQRVRLPADARDRGARTHATGTLHLPVPAPASPGSPGTAPAPPSTAPATPGPSPEPTASPTPTTSPTPTASASPQAQPFQQPPTAQASTTAWTLSCRSQPPWPPPGCSPPCCCFGSSNDVDANAGTGDLAAGSRKHPTQALSGRSGQPPNPSTSTGSTTPSGQWPPGCVTGTQPACPTSPPPGCPAARST